MELRERNERGRSLSYKFSVLSKAGRVFEVGGKRRKKRDGNTRRDRGRRRSQRPGHRGHKKNKRKRIPRSADSVRNDDFLHLAEMGSSGARPYKNKIGEKADPSLRSG